LLKNFSINASGVPDLDLRNPARIGSTGFFELKYGWNSGHAGFFMTCLKSSHLLEELTAGMKIVRFLEQQMCVLDLHLRKTPTMKLSDAFLSQKWCNNGLTTLQKQWKLHTY